MSWVTAQICDYCWLLVHGGEAIRLRHREETPCCRCKEPTSSGIWVRWEQ